MRRFFAFLIFNCLLLPAGGQVAFRTVVPSNPVIAGESFQVQYILEHNGHAVSLVTPEFRNLKKVAGPYSYSGTSYNGNPVYNTVYTLTASSKGRFIIPGASLNLDGKLIRSNDVVIEVITRQESEKRSKREGSNGSTDYYLAPGEKPDEKIRQNLFVRVSADKHSCYPGEPVVAEFKLYSRLESKSDITHNPGFYGFTVYDMVNLNDQQQSTEMVKGKLFSVHTIRKVQLFPEHEGQFQIDAMQIRHTVEFSTTETSKPTEQEIAEGVLNQHTYEDPQMNGKVQYESVAETLPISINVRPLPAAGKPAGFSGATGAFRIFSVAGKTQLALHEEGMLKVMLSGNGNFTQLNIPTVEWPEAIEGFEPVITDTLMKTSVPLSGSRVFSFPFIARHPGSYTIPPVVFSYFDPAKGSYMVVRSEPVTMQVSAMEKKNIPAIAAKRQVPAGNNRQILFYGIAAMIITVSILFYFFRSRRKKQVMQPAAVPLNRVTTIREYLLPAQSLMRDERSFSGALRQSVWNSCAEPLQLTGSLMHKQVLKQSLEKNGIPADTTSALLKILEECDAALFAGVPLKENPERMLEMTQVLLEQVYAALL